MTADIIIATYNRPKQVAELANSLSIGTDGICNIIIVDSTDSIGNNFWISNKIIHIRSSHQNQPYQRFLGYLASRSELLVFLDDDMELIEKEFIVKLIKIFKDKAVTGVAINFKNKHEDTLLKNLPRTRIFKSDGILRRFKGILSGYPQLPDGKFGLCGNRGKQPAGGGETEWVSGGAFAARRSGMFQNFNFQLFNIFERKLGMGEDGILGYSLSKQGRVIYNEELFFTHNDSKDSTYTKDISAFSERVAFSRLFLSLERARLNQSSSLLAHIHYHYFMLWRNSGLLINFLVSPSTIRWIMLKGSLKGWRQATTFKFSMSVDRANFWYSEASCDLSELHQNRFY